MVFLRRCLPPSTCAFQTVLASSSYFSKANLNSEPINGLTLLVRLEALGISHWRHLIAIPKVPPSFASDPFFIYSTSGDIIRGNGIPSPAELSLIVISFYGIWQSFWGISSSHGGKMDAESCAGTVVTLCLWLQCQCHICVAASHDLLLCPLAFKIRPFFHDIPGALQNALLLFCFTTYKMGYHLLTPSKDVLSRNRIQRSWGNPY